MPEYSWYILKGVIHRLIFIEMFEWIYHEKAVQLPLYFYPKRMQEGLPISSEEIPFTKIKNRVHEGSTTVLMNSVVNVLYRLEIM